MQVRTMRERIILRYCFVSLNDIKYIHTYKEKLFASFNVPFQMFPIHREKRKEKRNFIESQSIELNFSENGLRCCLF